MARWVQVVFDGLVFVQLNLTFLFDFVWLGCIPQGMTRGTVVAFQFA